VCRPSYPPALPDEPLAGELEEYDSWWQDDGIARHILCSRLGPGPWSVVPLKRNVHGTPVSTARDVFHILCETYGGGDHSSAGELKDQLIALHCGSTRDSVQLYVETWCSNLRQLERTEWDFTAFDLIHYFVRNLPDDEAYRHIRVAVSSGFAQDPPFYLPFESLVRKVLATDVENRRMIADRTRRWIGHNHSAAPSSALITSTTANPAPTTVTSSSAPPRSRTATCTNCSTSGHSIEHCWEPGGGDVGGRDRYLATRAKAHIATDPIPIPDITTPTQSTSIDPLQDTSPTHHSSVVPPVPASPAQSDIFYAYACWERRIQMVAGRRIHIVSETKM